MIFEERVRKYEYKLNDTDDQIVEYIVNHKKEVTKQSIQVLAVNVFTVPNTITRLSKKLGYDGFSHLKNSLKEEINAEQHEGEALHFYIQKTCMLIDEETLEYTAKMFYSAKRVICFGIGDNVSFCGMVVKNLRIAGTNAILPIHRHEIIQEIQSLRKSDVVFFISLSGESTQVLEAAQLAKEKGAGVVSLTHFEKNALQQLADISLFCYAPKSYKNGYNVTMMTPLMLVIETLSAYYWKYVESRT